MQREAAAGHAGRQDTLKPGVDPIDKDCQQMSTI